MADEANQPLLDGQSSSERPSADHPRPSYQLSTETSNSSHHRDDDEMTVYSSDQRLLQSSPDGVRAGDTIQTRSANGASLPLRNERSEPLEYTSERTSADRARISYELSSESTPLLHRREDELIYGTGQRSARSPSVVSLLSSDGGANNKRSRVRWPTVISLVVLTLSVLTILVFAFAAPAAVKEYAQQAAVFKPTAVSIDSTTPGGVRARIQGDFTMDSGRVKTKSVRGIGRLATWIAREVETGPSDVEVYLPEHGNVLVGNAALPSIKVNIRNGHHTHVDFLADLEAGDIRGIHAVAIDWIEGRLGRLSVKGKATVHLKSGLFALGTQVLTDNIIFEGIVVLVIFGVATYELTSS